MTYGPAWSVASKPAACEAVPVLTQRCPAPLVQLPPAPRAPPPCPLLIHTLPPWVLPLMPKLGHRGELHGPSAFL